MLVLISNGVTETSDKQKRKINRKTKSEQSKSESEQKTISKTILFTLT